MPPASEGARTLPAFGAVGKLLTRKWSVAVVLHVAVQRRPVRLQLLVATARADERFVDEIDDASIGSAAAAAFGQVGNGHQAKHLGGPVAWLVTCPLARERAQHL